MKENLLIERINLMFTRPVMCRSKLLSLIFCIIFLIPVTSCQTASKKTKIYNKILPERKILEICGGHPGPVIKQGDPGTEDNKYGFEGGRAFKVYRPAAVPGKTKLI